MLTRWKSSGLDCALWLGFSPTSACKRVDVCRRGTRASRNEKSVSLIHDPTLLQTHSHSFHKDLKLSSFLQLRNVFQSQIGIAPGRDDIHSLALEVSTQAASV